MNSNRYVEVLQIDGSFGEGGGQILRSTITLSCLTKKPVRIFNIRKNRKNPGLRPQHLTVVKVLGQIFNAKISGLKIDSTEIEFFPDKISCDFLDVQIGTAGSISLLLQAIIPTVSLAEGKIKMRISGGTDVLWSPSMDYTKHVVLPAFEKCGIIFSLDVIKRGYFPKGGGIVNVGILPCQKLKSIKFVGMVSNDINLICSFSKIADSKINELVERIVEYIKKKKRSVRYEVVNEVALDKGCVMTLVSSNSDSMIGADYLISEKMENNYEGMIDDFCQYDSGVDENLSDMLIIPCSLVTGMSVFLVKKITKHLETNLYITAKFTGCKYGIGKLKSGFEIRLIGNSNARIQN